MCGKELAKRKLSCKDEFYSAAFRRKVYRSVDEVQLDLEAWLVHYNNERTHSGKYCYGNTEIKFGFPDGPYYGLNPGGLFHGGLCPIM